MRNRLVFALIFLMATVAAAEPAAKIHPKAHASILNADGERIGDATFEQASGGVKVSLKVSRLPPGAHAFHIHAVGSCDPPDFKSSGGHFNPTHRKHGRENTEGPHAGDLPDLQIGPDGTGKAEAFVPGITLSGIGEESLFHPGGTAVVIHASADDNKTDPSGNSGARIACGVIKADL